MHEEASPLVSSFSASSPDHKKSMSKDKSKNQSVAARCCLALRSPILRYVAIAAILLSVSFLGFTYIGVPASMKLSPDRSEAYNVKVLPATLSDKALNTLSKDVFSFMAMIDAGSSGCRAHVYRYGKLGSKTGPLYVLPEHDSLKVKPGLSTFADRPQDAGASLKGLIDFMKEQVPEADWAVTPIWLKATAGLRMLEPAKSEAILTSVRNFLLDKKNSPFLFRPSYAKIIPGNEEGGFGWIAFNYLKRIIGPKRNPKSLETPYAVVEMGGASAQVSQVAPNPAAAAAIPPQYRFSFTIEEDVYQLYTHSYLGYGAEQAREQLNKELLTSATSSTDGAVSSTPVTVKDPCTNNGYVKPATDPIKEPYQGPGGVAVAGSGATSGTCMATLTKLFKQIYSGAQSTAAAIASVATAAATRPPNMVAKLSGEEPTCNPKTQPGPYSFGCVHQPDFVTQSANFLIFENFFYMSSGLAVKSVAVGSNSTVVTKPTFPLRTTAAYIQEAANQVCSLEWDILQSTYPMDNQPKDVNLKMCFSGSYAYSFLVDGLRIDKDKVVTVQKDVDGSDIEWALGAAYKEAADMLKRTNLRPT